MSSDDRLALDLLIRGFQVSRTIRLVADLGLADRIDPEGAATVEELASASGVQGLQLMRALRALAAFHIFGVDADHENPWQHQRPATAARSGAKWIYSSCWVHIPKLGRVGRKRKRNLWLIPEP